MLMEEEDLDKDSEQELLECQEMLSHISQEKSIKKQQYFKEKLIIDENSYNWTEAMNKRCRQKYRELGYVKVLKSS